MLLAADRRRPRRAHGGHRRPGRRRAAPLAGRQPTAGRRSSTPTAPGTGATSSWPSRSAVGDFYRAVFGWELASVDVGGDEALMVRRPGYGDHLAELEPGIRERQDESGAPPGFADAVGWMERAAGGRAGDVADRVRRRRHRRHGAASRRARRRGARRAVRRRTRAHRRAGRRSGHRVHDQPLRPVAALSALGPAVRVRRTSRRSPMGAARRTRRDGGTRTTWALAASPRAHPRPRPGRRTA